MRRAIDTAATVLAWGIATLGWVAFWWIVGAFLYWIFFELK